MKHLRIVFLLILVVNFQLYSQIDYNKLQRKIENRLKKSKFQEAYDLAKNMGSQSKSLFGDTSYWYFMSHVNLGDCFYMQYDTDSTIYYWDKAIKIAKRNNTDESGEQIVFLSSDISEMLFDEGDFINSNKYLNAAIIEGQMNNLINTNQLIDLLERRWINSYKMGDFVLAEKYIQEKIHYCSKSIDENYEDRVYDLNNLSTMLSAQGDYKAASKYLQECLILIEQFKGKKTPEFLYSLFNSGLNYFSMGNISKARKLLHEGFKILSNLDPSKFDEIISNDLRFSYHQMLGELDLSENKFSSAESNFLIAKKILETSGEENPDFHFTQSQIFENLGYLYLMESDLTKSRNYFDNVLSYYLSDWAIGPLHFLTAQAYRNLYMLNILESNFSEAESNILKAQKIMVNNYGNNSSLHIEILNDLARFYMAQQKFNNANNYFKVLFSKNIFDIGHNFGWLSSYEKEAYWAQENEFYSDLNTFASMASIAVPSSTELSYNGNLVSKSLLLETSRELDQALASSSDTTLKENYQNLKALRKNYSKLMSEGSDNKELMERLNGEADSLDKILVNSLGEYAASKRKFEITWKDIQSNLNSTEAAIEFTKYYDDKDSVDKYMALVIRPDYEYPKLALLGEEEQISEYIENRSFEALYPLVWEPIEKHLSGVERVYYSPAGQLNNLAFSALCMGERKELSQKDKDSIIARGEILTESTSSFECEYLMDRYELHQLTTTRYIADGALNKKTTMNTSIALGGGINYDTVPKAYSENKEEDNTEYIFAMNLQQEQEKAKENTKRSSKNTSKMSYLEGTKKEVDQVAALFENKNWSLSAYTDTKAEEGKFKEEVEKNKAGIIHIATHGFAFPDVKKNKRQHQLMGTEEISYRASEDPMVRCGLMFSGSNVSWTGNPQKMIKETGEDGILTAAEVSNMDLSNTKLVVLSACETGLGKIEGSEGTFGLKRGFKLAGVEQMIVSLWSVPDKETMELMTLFYEDLTQSLNPVKSFEKAQKQMRESYPKRPDLWAGFVLVR